MQLTETPKLIQPRDHKAKISIWADLSVSDMDVLAECVTPDQVKGELARIFLLDDFKENLKHGILVDFYYYTIMFARDNDFTKEQTSAFFSILKQTHGVAIETPFGNIEHTFRYFRELVLCHAVKRPPYSIDLFNPDQVRKITEYVINTYFRHFKMYKYVFTPLVRLDLSMTYIGLPESPPASEAGEPSAEDQAAELETGDAEGGAENAEQGADGEGAEPEKKEEHPAAKELKTLIRDHLNEEMKRLKSDVEQQIKLSEDTLNKRLQEVEAPGSGKGRVSAKGKKK